MTVKGPGDIGAPKGSSQDHAGPHASLKGEGDEIWHPSEITTAPTTEILDPRTAPEYEIKFKQSVSPEDVYLGVSWNNTSHRKNFSIETTTDELMIIFQISKFVFIILLLAQMIRSKNPLFVFFILSKTNILCFQYFSMKLWSLKMQKKNKKKQLVKLKR